MDWLAGMRVLDATTGIAGAYATKLFVDAGAEVVKLELPAGDPMRRWSATGSLTAEGDAPLFRFLHAGKRSVASADRRGAVERGAGAFDLLVEDATIEGLDLEGLRRAQPRLVVLSITPWGRSGPHAHRPATEFVLQAESGSIASRGAPGAEPFQAGGRVVEWLAGPFAAVPALAAVRAARAGAPGRWIDFSLLEVACYGASNFGDLFFSLAAEAFGLSEPPGRGQSLETPSIEPTRDGYVGFCTNSHQQFSDFLLMIERPDLREDAALFQVPTRMARIDEWSAIVRAWTSRHTTSEVIDAASLLRIPVAPVCNGETVLDHAHLQARGVFVRDATDAFTHPRPPYAIGGVRPRTGRPAPALGELDGDPWMQPSRPAEPRPTGRAGLPLEGLRVVDMTAWWAGPSATHMLATLGADVVHVEAVQRIDGMRTTGGMMRGRADAWWEYSAFFLAANANKRGITLNLTDARGVRLARQLIADADAVVENFTPRVLEGFGLDWDTLHADSRSTIMVRMPAFGLDGPWRDHTGFAQTMEQLSGMAWVTGHADDQPRIQRGPCDPLAGMHAAWALLVALGERERTGVGQLVEVTMVEGALNAAAEQVIEWTAHGRRLERQGNRSPEAAPQGLYAAAGSRPGEEDWLAISVATNAQWRALCTVLGRADWEADAALATLEGRRTVHDALDAGLRAWAAQTPLGVALERLGAAGVPVGRVVDARRASRQPQIAARGFFEEIDHPVVGTHATPTVPFRLDGVERWIRRPAPTVGQHAREVLAERLGLSAAELDALEADAVIGTAPELG